MGYSSIELIINPLTYKNPFNEFNSLNKYFLVIQIKDKILHCVFKTRGYLLLLSNCLGTSKVPPQKKNREK